MRPEFEAIQTELDRIRGLPDDHLLVESMEYLQGSERRLICDWQAELETRVTRITTDFSERVHNGLRDTISIDEVRHRQALYEASERYKGIIDPTYGKIQVIGHG